MTTEEDHRTLLLSPKGHLVTPGSHQSNLHRGLETIIKRAGLAWLGGMTCSKRSAEPDFAPPSTPSANGIGHSMAVSERRCLQVDDETLAAGSTRDGVSQLRAAQSTAVGSDTAPQVQVTHGNDQANRNTIIAPAKAENPRNNRGFRDWDRRDSNPEPKDYESSALTD